MGVGIEYILLFYVEVKDETLAIIKSDSNLYNYLIEFTGLYSEKVPSEIRTVIDQMLTD